MPRSSASWTSAPHLGLAEVPATTSARRRSRFARAANARSQRLHREWRTLEPVGDRQQPPADLARADAASQPVVSLVPITTCERREADLEQLLGRQQVHGGSCRRTIAPVAKTDYSGTPLSKKLGAKPGAEVVVLLHDAPRRAARAAAAAEGDARAGRRALDRAGRRKAPKLETDLDFAAVQQARRSTPGLARQQELRDRRDWPRRCAFV